MGYVSEQGRLTRDAELFRFPGSNILKVTLRLAKNCRVKPGSPPKSLFIDAVCLADTAERAQFLKKGTLVNVEGDLDTEVWTDTTTKEERRKIFILVRPNGIGVYQPLPSMESIRNNQGSAQGEAHDHEPEPEAPPPPPSKQTASSKPAQDVPMPPRGKKGGKKQLQPAGGPPEGHASNGKPGDDEDIPF